MTAKWWTVMALVTVALVGGCADDAGGRGDVRADSVSGEDAAEDATTRDAAAGADCAAGGWSGDVQPNVSDTGAVTYCSQFVLGSDECMAAFACSRPLNEAGCWDEAESCCACETADCGAPCSAEGDCEGRCMACGSGQYPCADGRCAPGYCGPIPKPRHLMGCFYYYDAQGKLTSYCADPA